MPRDYIPPGQYIGSIYGDGRFQPMNYLPEDNPGHIVALLIYTLAHWKPDLVFQDLYLIECGEADVFRRELYGTCDRELACPAKACTEKHTCDNAGRAPHTCPSPMRIAWTGSSEVRKCNCCASCQGACADGVKKRRI